MTAATEAADRERERPVFVIAVGHDLDADDAERIQRAVAETLRDGRYQPGVVWLVRDPNTCTTCPGDVIQVYATQPEADEYTARLPRRGLIIERWDVPGHE